MAEQGQRRKLEAILSADVVGYSRLMQDDDAATVETLTKYRAIFNDFVSRHEGRIVDSPGDNILAEFDSPVEAVQCAVELQREFARRNRQLAEHRQMQFRIGINLGDILSRDDGTIYGDGVNVAARLEALAEPGGIMISESARMQVRSLVDVSIADAGEHEVKNIAEPVHVYRIVLDETVARRQGSRNVPRAIISITGTAALVIAIVVTFVFRPVGEPEDLVFTLPDKPSIAVLPFTNMSGDPEQAYFADGITETLITDLARVRNMMVIARNSTFSYKGKSVDVRQVGQELGVRYVLEGSVQKAGDQLRINVQLIDAQSGSHLWADRYDRPLENIFEIQDEIIQTIIAKMDVKLVSQDANLWRSGTENPDAYDKFMRATQAQHLYSQADNIRSRELAEEALELDPDYVQAMLVVGWSHALAADFGWSESQSESYQMAIEWANKATAVDGSIGTTWILLGDALKDSGDIEGGMKALEKAVALGPNFAVNNIIAGWHMALVGRADEALQLIKTGMRLDPRGPAYYFAALGDALTWSGRYDEALPAYQKALDESPMIWAQIGRTVALSQLGRMEEARAQADELHQTYPNFSLDRMPYTMDPVSLETLKTHLRRAGIE